MTSSQSSCSEINKFCVNCVQYKSDMGIAYCLRKNDEIDLVDGKLKKLYCAVERGIESKDVCGIDGKYYFPLFVKEETV